MTYKRKWQGRGIWFCKIGVLGTIELPQGSDLPMRQAVQRAFKEITGQDAEFCFSGWNAQLDECELAVVEDRMPDPRKVAAQSPARDDQ